MINEFQCKTINVLCCLTMYYTSIKGKERTKNKEKDE